MALTYKIKDFGDLGDGNVMVGFEVTDDSDKSIFLIDKTIAKGSKSDDAITEEAYNAAQTEVNTWINSKSNVGKIFDPSSKKLK